jgi:hypothetical protein
VGGGKQGSRTVAEGWSAGDAEIVGSSKHAEGEERLVLIDRIAGLEAQVAELSARFSATPTQQLAVEQQLIRMQHSLAWRLGRALTSPQTVVRRMIRR